MQRAILRAVLARSSQDTPRPTLLAKFTQLSAWQSVKYIISKLEQRGYRQGSCFCDVLFTKIHGMSNVLLIDAESCAGK